MTDTTAPVRGKTSSLAIVTGLYVVAVAAGVGWLYLGLDTAYLWLDALLADLVATAVVFAGSRIVHNSSCYDAYWSVIPPLLAVYWWLERDPGADGVRYALLSVVLWLWAVRLTANWVYSWPGLHHEDWRYPMLRDKNPKAELPVDLMAIHVFPTLQVFAAMLPVYAVTRSDRPWGWLDLVAMFLGASIPMMEQRSLERRPGYQDVIDRVPMLLPRPPRRS